MAIPSRFSLRCRMRRVPVVCLLLVVVAACGDDSPDDEPVREAMGIETSSAGRRGGEPIVRVPDDADTISDAIEHVAEGGLILVGPGRYPESVVIDVPGVTLRGTDRNQVIIDGESSRADGVRVVADGVRLQNFTVIDHINNGVLVTGLSGDATRHPGSYTPAEVEGEPLLQRFEVSHVTASNNALYGIYAFHAQHGSIVDSYASGSPDAGIYVGQCVDCDVLVARNVAERNAVGFENANASGVTIAGNRFSGNRVGLTLTTNFQEAFVPQRDNVVIGNVIAANQVAETPAQADGGFGIGIGLAGAQGNRLVRNRIVDHAFAGVLIEAAGDVPSIDNHLYANQISGNATDVVDLAPERSPSHGNCRVDAGEDGSTGDAPLDRDLGSDACASAGELVVDRAAHRPLVPPGIDYFDVERGKRQPDWNGVLDEVPGPLPASPDADELYEIVLPDVDLLEDQATTSTT